MPLHKINGQWIHYEDTGGDAMPVVLAHGLLMDGEMFAPQLALQSPDCRIVTWDARGHGETENTDDPFTYWDLADDLTGLLDHLGIRKAVIGGMSQGGFIALRFALQHPERVSALILLGTQAGSEDPVKVATYRTMLDVWETDGLNDQLAETNCGDHAGQRLAGSPSLDHQVAPEARARSCARRSKRWPDETTSTTGSARSRRPHWSSTAPPMRRSTSRRRSACARSWPTARRWSPSREAATRPTSPTRSW